MPLSHMYKMPFVLPHLVDEQVCSHGALGKPFWCTGHFCMYVNNALCALLGEQVSTPTALRKFQYREAKTKVHNTRISNHVLCGTKASQTHLVQCTGYIRPCVQLTVIPSAWSAGMTCIWCATGSIRNPFTQYCHSTALWVPACQASCTKFCVADSHTILSSVDKT